MHKAALTNKADQTKEVLSHHKVAIRLRLIANFNQFRNSIATTSASIGMVALQRFMTILERTKELNGMRKHNGWRILIPTEGRAILLLTILNILSSTLPQCMTIILRYRYLYASSTRVLRCSVRYTGMYTVG